MKSFEITNEIREKWAPILESEGAPTIKDSTVRNNLIRVLENTARAAEQGDLSEAMTVTGEALLREDNVTADVARFDPVLMSLIRRTQPSLVANDLVGVQPMSGPTGLIFVMRVNYENSDGTRTETFNHTVPDVNRSGDGAGAGMATADGEILGRNNIVDTSDSGAAADPVLQANPWQEMSFAIEKTTVTAVTRALKARYTRELEQDLRAIHGLDAGTELTNILRGELVAEIDREIIASARSLAVDVGDFGLTDDTDGRWEVEKYKALAVKIEREANLIARGTRRGKGNKIVTSATVAGALRMAGSVDTSTDMGTFNAPNTVGLAYVGKFQGGYDLYVDPYLDTDEVMILYKGANVYDAGLFYCPYIPLELVRAVGEEDFQPRMGFKTRYGLQANPFGNVTGVAALGNGNQYFRKFTVTQL